MYDNWVLHVNRKLKVMELHQDSYIRGYHIYNEIRTAVLGKVLLTERELHNMVDRYAVAVKKHSGEIVGHLHTKKCQGYVAFLWSKVETLLCDTRSS